MSSIHNPENSFWHNLCDYEREELPFVDSFSRFGVGFDARSLGPAFLYPRATCPPNHDDDFLHPVLSLWLEENGQLAAVHRKEMTSLPWAAIERSWLHTDSGRLGIEATHVYADDQTILCEYRFSSEGGDHEIAPLWAGCLQQDIIAQSYLKFYNKAESGKRISFLEPDCKNNTLWFGWRRPEIPSDLPQVGCLLQWDRKGMGVTAAKSAYSAPRSIDSFDTEPVYYRIQPADTLAVKEGGSISICFRLTFQQAFADKQLNRPKLTGGPASAVDFIPSARKNFLHQAGLDDQPAFIPKSLPERKILEARFHLLRNGIRGGNGHLGDKRGNLCSASRNFSCLFFWDAIFTSVALSQFNQDYARDCLETVFLQMDPRDGATPERTHNFDTGHRTLIHSPQSPIASWALCEYLDKFDDRAFADRFYPILCRNHDYWKDYCDADGDGLSEYRWSGQAADDSPLWDPVAVDMKAGYNWLPPVASVALNCFLYKDARHLAEICRYLEKPEDSERWTTRADFLAKRLLEVCYLQEENRFWDYNQYTREYRKVKTFYLFWPLFVELPMPEETRRDLIENVLLDPEKFFGEIPFPSVAYDEPEYDPEGYWRGRSWPHISYWLLETLSKQGYAAEADEAARRIIARESEIAVFTENTVTTPSIYNRDGFCGYSWGSAAAYLIHSKHYQSKQNT